MRIGILSDTHDQEASVRTALELLRQRGVELVLHCGDIESPATVQLFRGLPTHFVWGNWDGVPTHTRAGVKHRDYGRLRAAIAASGGHVQEPFGHLELAGRKIAWVHGHDRKLRQELEEMDYFDYLFYGHTHAAEQHRTGRTLVVNPGALFRARPRQFAVLDLDSGTLESVVVR
jgi:putative phosphoesterase